VLSGPINRRRRLGVLALLLALPIVAAGCGGTTIDSVKAEETIKASLESKKGLDRKLASIDCPGGVDVQPGATFECSLRFPGGQTGRAVLKIRDSEADLNLEDVLPHTLLKEAAGNSE
jgi:hypothetical protein